jgi:signal transduction histidine kinase
MRLENRNQEIDLLRQVQSRILRHNIRTEVSMIQGQAKLAASNADGQLQQRMETIIDAGTRLSTISDKAGVVEELFENERSALEYDLRGCVDRAVNQVRVEYPELSVSVAGAESCPVTASPHLQTAVENLLENAIEHNDSREPQVSVRIQDRPVPALTVADNGPGIPQQEIAVLENQEETSLEHGSGIGLWLVKWIADRSDVELAFETGPSGTAVTLRFSAETDQEPTARAPEALEH